MYAFISIAAVISYFLPLLLLAVKRLWKEKFFVLFAAYWAAGGAVNTTDLIPGLSREIRSDISLIYNLVDIPFILIILYFTTTSLLVRRAAFYSTLAAVLSEVISLNAYGFGYEALKYPLGIGIGLVLAIVSWEIFRYLQKVEHSNTQNAKIFIYAALLFEYASFILIYIFDYFVDSRSARDNFLIYYISSVVALFVASCGYLQYRKYDRHKARLSSY